MVDHGSGMNVGHPLSHPHGHAQSMHPGGMPAANMGGGAGPGNGSAQPPPPPGNGASGMPPMNGPTPPGRSATTPGPPPSATGAANTPAPPPHSQASSSTAQAPPPPSQTPSTATQRLAAINEQTWIQLGTIADQMQEYDRAISCFESALRHNPYSVPALTKIGVLCKSRNQFQRAVEYFQRIINVDNNNGEIWGLLGHCYLLMDDLQKAYNAYQQALYLLPNANDAKLWYGIGILYDRYGSYEHAEEAFSVSLRIDPKYEKAGEIYFRLGIIYKQLQKYNISLDCFRYILPNPPPPLSELDIWFQIGNVHEQQKEYALAKEAFERVLAANPSHAKALQQLGWLYHQPHRNPTYWCSIGVLYYQINQYRDALDAYTRAIRLNPYISEVWYDLGTLYESCNSNQTNDALDAYQRAAELDPTNPHIKQRLQLLRSRQANGGVAVAG
ncbi:hypothetical protein SYNPS1DRAFT_21908 [Syncephalis pseudoplumigaleata]|uniref:Uncharacterized protein n=1 Tax=Syncephalis pseudoplumigaleata TaxID=1712513 RepID=A0A4P9Z1R2_9FUNG|nr:hypothetical protein SYNPS1DRAFT_21908 [Syncephalis pseudoplumigaleata]|eukprot:RKP26306.1 hypothetical protein SYNPS1DRAFT_21908 [Syncephalis pseudoplumigaleata]